MTQTAVDYLFDRLSTLYLFKDALLAKRALEEAKAIEKQQIIDAFWNGDNTDCSSEQNSREFAEKYYNETYKP